MNLSRLINVAGLAALFVSSATADLRLPMSEALKNAINKPAPQYSAMAKQMRVAGKVEIEAMVAADGSVKEARAVSGNPLLTASAVLAVQKWKFNPFTADGQPTEAIVMLSFDFKQ